MDDIIIASTYSSTRNLKLINKIILHCSDSDRAEHDDIAIIRRWHRARGFTDVGYHFFIQKNGTLQTGRPITHIGAHCVTENVSSIGICLSGAKKFTQEQFAACYNLCMVLSNRFRITKQNILPHNAFNSQKTCPNFDLKMIWQFEKNIDIGNDVR